MQQQQQQQQAQQQNGHMNRINNNELDRDRIDRDRDFERFDRRSESERSDGKPQQSSLSGPKKYQEISNDKFSKPAPTGLLKKVPSDRDFGSERNMDNRDNRDRDRDRSARDRDNNDKRITINKNDDFRSMGSDRGDRERMGSDRERMGGDRDRMVGDRDMRMNERDRGGYDRSGSLRDKDRHDYRSPYDRDSNPWDRDRSDRGGGYRDMRDDRDRDRERDAGGVPFSRQFQQNIPPRFKKQMERTGGGNERSNNNSGTDGGYNTLNNRNNLTSSNSFNSTDKNIPFAQQYDARFIHSNYKSQQQQQQQQQQQIRRNQSDDVIRRRRGDSEDDDHFSSGRESIGRNSNIGTTTPQLARSISDSSQRKTSVSSEEKCSAFERVERSESREFESWADELEGECNKKLDTSQTSHKTESVSSEHSISTKESVTTPEEPKHILQRSKVTPPSSSHPPTIVEVKDKDEGAACEKEKTPPPKSWAEASSDESFKSSQPSSNEKENISDKVDANKSLESIPEKQNEPIVEENLEDKSSVGIEKTVSSPPKEGGDGLDAKHEIKRSTHSRGGANMSQNRHHQMSSRGGGGGYQGGYHRGNWNSRGGGPRRGGRYNDNYSESEGSEEEDYNNRRPGKPVRKDSGGSTSRYESSRSGSGTHNKDGFAPRGEPSRRGRGSSSAFRRGGMTSTTKRIDGYGPPSSKSPFGANDDSSNKNKSESESDKTKLNQIALNTGLTSKTGPPPNKKDDPNLNKSNSSLNTISQNRNNDKRPSPPKNIPPSTSNTINNSNSTQSKVNFTGGNKIESQNTSASKKDDKSSDESNKNIDKKQTLPKKDENMTQSNRTSQSMNKSKESIPNPMQTNHQSSKPAVTGGSNKISQNIPQKQNFGCPPTNNQTLSGGQHHQQSGQQHHSQGHQGGHHQGGQHHQQKPKPHQIGGGAPNISRQDSRQDNVRPENRIDNRQDNRQSQDNRQGGGNKLAPRFTKQIDTGGPRPQGGQGNNSGNSSVISNAWENPLNTSSLRSSNDEHVNISNQTFGGSDHPTNDNETGGQTSVIGNNDKLSSMQNKTDSNKQQQQPLLDGSTPIVQTIIFENTNYKAVPIKRQQNAASPGQIVQHGGNAGCIKSDDVFVKSPTPSGPPQQQQQQQNLQQQTQQQQQSTHSSSSSSIPTMLDGTTQETMPPALTAMNFQTKSDVEYEKEINKIAFNFETDLTLSGDDKSVAASKNSLMMSRTGQSVTTADLNMKIASVKKVWESVPAMSNVLEQNQQDDHSAASHLTSNYVASQHQPHLHQFVTHTNLAHVHALSPVPPYSGSFGDPSIEQHFSKQDGSVENEYAQAVANQHIQGHPQHQNPNMNLVKHAADVLGSNSNVCKVKPNQQQMHQSGLAGLSPPPMQQGTIQTAPQQYYQPQQFGNMSTIPSPPAVLFNSSMQSQGGLYTPFQIEAGRPQYSQYAAHYGTSNAPYSAYMQTPPNMQPTPTPPDMYPNLTTQYRIPQTVQTPFNQNQPITNPNTVLISSSSNSLMSASVKPSSQQIGAIGSKTGAVGHPQQYMNMYSQQAPPLQSNSYYSSSAANQGFFGGPGAGGTPSYSLQSAGMFGGHGGPTPTNAPPPQPQNVANYGSQFLSSPLLAAAALNQQYRTPQQATPGYLKSNPQQSHISDPVSSTSFFK